MNKILLSVTLAATLTWVSAPGAAELHLPDFDALDADAVPVTGSELGQGGNWVLAVVDGGLPSARRFLDALGSKNERFGSNVVVLVVGTTQQFDALRSAYVGLGDVRWLRAQNPGVLATLGLTGVPARFALHPDGRIATRRAGLGRSPDEVARQVRAWAGSSAQGEGEHAQ
ncbi:hypothetical protein [Methyloversatilis thermotolerans]|uniref:hypothetical protein n=1 Tax=Methyloversatilis thermotolerans TaxID=1346290 RepID=UPI00037D762B|nr:hypothetical protein [Methyloversatilis thermotolerans]